MNLRQWLKFGAILLWAASLWACSGDPGATSESGACDEAGCAQDNRGCEMSGSEARCTGCLEGFVDRDGSCEPVQRCVDLGCGDDNRVCTEAGAHSDAACGDCRPGFMQGADGMCVAEAEAVCEPADDAASIIGRCRDEQNRGCQQTDDGARCAECLAGFTEPDGSTNAACVPVETCEDIDETCDGVCLPHDNTDAECVENPCDQGQAFIPGAPAGEACVACNFDGLDGCTAEILPKASGSDRCVCKTEAGYFWNPNRTPVAGPEVCDKDEDGWVDKRAAGFYTDPTGDPTLKDAASCNWHRVNQFVLVNDVSGDANRSVTVAELTGGALTAVILQEAVRNDDPAELQKAYDDGDLAELSGPADTSVRLPASALNSLVKVCADTTSDFNANGATDLTEIQRKVPAGDAQQLFDRLTHFTALSYGRFEPPAQAGGAGRYLITAYKRGQTLGVNYGADAGSYWQHCPRFRDRLYVDASVPDDKRIGVDFAQFSTPPSDHLIKDASQWRGMNHSSQFKCINVVNTEPAAQDDGPHVLLKSDLTDADAPMTLNACDFGASVEQPDSVNPATARLTCAETPADQIEAGVSWAAVDYIARPQTQGYQYRRGCADMCEVWRAPACPGTTSGSGKCFTDPDNFGRRSCGCSLTYGGRFCDTGCPSTDQVLTSPDYNPTRRDGKYWVCGDIAADYMSTPFEGAPSSEPYRLVGRVRVRARGADLIGCDPATEDCQDEHTIR